MLTIQPIFTLRASMHVRNACFVLLASLVALGSVWPGSCCAQAAKPYQREFDRANMTAEQKKAETFAAKLMGRAQQAMAVRDFPTASSNYEAALETLEGAYGRDHLRLVDVLNKIVQTRFAARSDVKDAVIAQERIVAILDAHEGVPTEDRVGAMAVLGDVYLYQGDKRALDTYRAAWVLAADADSPEGADALFSTVNVVRLELPPNPRDHDEWVVTVHYDVDAAGKVAVSEVTGDGPYAFKSSLHRRYEDARFRPRLVGGEPVETRAISFSHTYRSTLELP